MKIFVYSTNGLKLGFQSPQKKKEGQGRTVFSSTTMSYYDLYKPNSKSMYMACHLFQTKKKLTCIKSKTLVKLKICLGTSRCMTSIHCECFKTFYQQCGLAGALSPCNFEKQISISTVLSKKPNLYLLAKILYVHWFQVK